MTSSANVLCARCHSHHIAVVETVRHAAAARVAAVMHPPQWGLRSPQEYRRVVEGMYDARRPPLSVAAQVLSLATRVLVCTITGRAPSRPIATSPPNPLIHCILQARAASASTPYPLHTSALAPPPPTIHTDSWRVWRRLTPRDPRTALAPRHWSSTAPRTWLCRWSAGTALPRALRTGEVWRSRSS